MNIEKTTNGPSEGGYIQYTDGPSEDNYAQHTDGPSEDKYIQHADSPSEDNYIQHADGLSYKLKKPFDFSFLKKYGTVFKVYDDQDSGNICFGIDGVQKLFVKFAGAPTVRACVGESEAVNTLKRAERIYRDLAHPNLVKLLEAEEIGGGYAMVFEWADAECMHPMYPLSRRKFLAAPIKTRLRMFDDILIFHAHVINKGYIALDFYDGSVMYDFNNRRTIICDIDFYRKTPCFNDRGRMWGSSRFMSPEEFTLGAELDEVTNVYTMGAAAFALFGDETDRVIRNWKLNDSSFQIAKKAVGGERRERQRSIVQFIDEWNAALNQK